MLATYVSATQFTVVGDQTTIFVTNRRVKCDCGVDGFKYGTISTSAYTSLTTVTLTAESDDLTANLTDVEWSVQIPIAVPVHNHSDESSGGDLSGSYELVGEIDGIPIDTSHIQDGAVLKYEASSGTFVYSESGPTAERWVTIAGGKNKNAKDTYLDGAGYLPGGLTPLLILPFDAELMAMSAACNGNYTWVAEVHVGGVLKAGATVTVTATDNAYDNSYTGITFSAGDKIELYINSTGVDVSRPMINAIMRLF